MSNLNETLGADFPHRETLMGRGLDTIIKIVDFLDLDHDLADIDDIDRAASDDIIRVVQDAVAEANDVQN